jgi:hypothetical protein
VIIFCVSLTEIDQLTISGGSPIFLFVCLFQLCIATTLRQVGRCSLLRITSYERCCPPMATHTPLQASRPCSQHCSGKLTGTKCVFYRSLGSSVSVVSLRANEGSRVRSVGIALGYGLDDRGSRVRFLTGAGNFSLHHRVQNGSGPTQPPIQWAPGALSLGVKRPRREPDRSPPSSAEVKE